MNTNKASIAILVVIAVVLGIIALKPQTSNLSGMTNLSDLTVDTLVATGLRTTTSTFSGAAQFDTITATTSITAASGTITNAFVTTLNATTSLAVGTTTAITGYLCGTATWNPPAVTSTTSATTSVTVAGYAIGDPIFAGFSATTTAADGTKLVLNAVGTAASSTLVSLSMADNADNSINAATGTVKVCTLR